MATENAYSKTAIELQKSLHASHPNCKVKVKKNVISRYPLSYA